MRVIARRGGAVSGGTPRISRQLIRLLERDRQGLV
jgi:hypothetical protein